MKKLITKLLPAILLLTVVSAIYVPLRSKNNSTPAVITNETPASSSQEQQHEQEQLNYQVALKEAEVTKQPESEEARRELIIALFRRGEATSNAADFDRARNELARADELAPDSRQVAAVRVKLMRAERRYKWGLQVAAHKNSTATHQK